MSEPCSIRVHLRSSAVDFLAGALLILAAVQSASAQCPPSLGYDGTGLNNWPHAMLTLDNGDLIVGGRFTQAGGVPANHIARFDGTSWHALGGGFNGAVSALIEYRGDIIAGGHFTHADGVRVNHIARWDGSTWQPLAEGVTRSQHAQVIALAVYEGELIVGGRFATAGGAPANNLARWNGASAHWTPFGTGVSGTIYSLLAHDDMLFAAGGGFSTIDGVRALRIGVWDGLKWSPLGSGVNLNVNDMVIFEGDLIVAGMFSEAGGVRTGRVARWNFETSQWTAVGNGFVGVPGTRPLTGTEGGAVFALSVYNGTLFAGGHFALQDDPDIRFAAVWDGMQWQSIGEGVSDAATVFGVHNGKLVAGGRFRMAGDRTVNYITDWDVLVTLPILAQLVGDTSRTFDAVSSPLLPGTAEERARRHPPSGGSSTCRVSDPRERHSTNSPPTCALPSSAQATSSVQPTGSNASERGGTQRSHEARDSSAIVLHPPIWASKEPLEEGTRLREWMGGFGLGTVSAMLEYQGDLFAAVNYWPNRSESVRVLLRWSSDDFNSGAWEIIGTLDQAVLALIEYDGALVAAGSFTTINGEPYNRIAKWRDGTWTSLAYGFTGSAIEERDAFILDLVIHDGALIVGGNFTHADDRPASNLARWDADNHSWEPLAGDVRGTIGSLASWRGNLVVAGNRLRSVDSVKVNRIAMWNGSEWVSVGRGANRWVDSLAVYRDDLIVSGRFSKVGDVPAARVARWDGSSWHAMGSGMGGGAYQSPRLVQRYGSDQSGRVNRLLVHNDSLYAGGIFGLNDDPEVLFLAKWNGGEWESTGRTARQYIRSMAIHNGVLTTGGIFHLRSADPVYYFERVPPAPADATVASSVDRAFHTTETLINADSADSVRLPDVQIVRGVVSGLADEQPATSPHEVHAAITKDEVASVVNIAAPMAQSEDETATLPEFQAIPVNGPSPFVYTWLMDLNNAGEAVGYASAAAPALDPARAYLWSAGDASDPAIDLGDFGQGWPYATAEAVNDAGTVVGWAQIGPATYRGFLWREPGPMAQLSQFAKAIDIDNDGRVLGITLSGGGAIWESGTYTTLPPLPGGGVFSPAAMNDHGQVVGSGFSTTGGKVHAFVYDNGGYVDLGIAPDDDFDSLARAINNNGVIAGMSRRLGATAITSRMVIWEPSGNGQWQMAHIVDPLPGTNVLEVMDINDAGDVVGMSGWPQIPVLWTGGALHDLSALLAPAESAVFFIATAINDAGWIAVDGQFGCCGYVLKPVFVPGQCPADLTGDGLVNVFDLLQLLAAWGQCGDPSHCPADLTGDGVVNVFDLLELLASWGACP